METRIEVIKTQGDRIDHVPFSQLEGKGFFTKELEDAQLDGRIDLAVHSLKDLATEMPAGLTLAAMVGREDPREVLLARNEAVDADRVRAGEILPLRDGVRIGTSAVRRQAQVHSLRPDLEIADLRGNVPTRVERLREGRYGAILLANAGLVRLDLTLDDLFVHPLDVGQFVPAPAQGMMGIQCRDEEPWRNTLARLHCPEDGQGVAAERQLLQRLEGGCQLPFGVNILKTGIGMASRGISDLIPRRRIAPSVEPCRARSEFPGRAGLAVTSRTGELEPDGDVNPRRPVPRERPQPVLGLPVSAGPPLFFQSANGSRFTDEDGRCDIDFRKSWRPVTR